MNTGSFLLGIRFIKNFCWIKSESKWNHDLKVFIFCCLSFFNLKLSQLCDCGTLTVGLYTASHQLIFQRLVDFIFPFWLIYFSVYFSLADPFTQFHHLHSQLSALSGFVHVLLACSGQFGVLVCKEVVVIFYRFKLLIVKSSHWVVQLFGSVYNAGIIAVILLSDKAYNFLALATIFMFDLLQLLLQFGILLLLPLNLLFQSRYFNTFFYYQPQKFLFLMFHKHRFLLLCFCAHERVIFWLIHCCKVHWNVVEEVIASCWNRLSTHVECLDMNVWPIHLKLLLQSLNLMKRHLQLTLKVLIVPFRLFESHSECWIFSNKCNLTYLGESWSWKIFQKWDEVLAVVLSFFLWKRRLETDWLIGWSSWPIINRLESYCVDFARQCIYTTVNMVVFEL